MPAAGRRFSPQAVTSTVSAGVTSWAAGSRTRARHSGASPAPRSCGDHPLRGLCVPRRTRGGSTYHVARSMVLLLVSRRFQLFILCLIAPLVINPLTPELITSSIISWGYHYRPLYFLAWSAFAFAAAVFIAIIVSRPGREYITPQLSSRVSIHPSRLQSWIVFLALPVILSASSMLTHRVSSWGNIPFEYWRVSSPALSSSSTPSVPMM